MTASSRPKKKVRPVVSKASRRAAASTLQKQTEWPNIKYDQIIEYDAYVTGIAHYQDPGGLGKCAMKVSGTRDAILGYAAQARIVRLQIVPIDQVDHAALDKRRQAATAYWHEVWLERLSRLQKVVDESGSELLADPDKLWQTARDVERAEQGNRPRIDWAYDQLIEIEPEGDLREGEGYALSFQIDPPLLPFQGQYYALNNPGAWYLYQVSGSVSAWEGSATYWTGGMGITYYGVTVVERAGGNAYYSISVDGMFFS